MTDNVRNRTGQSNQTNWMTNSQSGFDRMQQETDRAAARRLEPFKPFRFWIKRPDAGVNEMTITILDVKVEAFFYEHTFNSGRGKGMTNEMCSKEYGDCPLCDNTDKYSHSSYVALISILAHDPYTDKQGVHHKYSKRIMTVKPNNISYFKDRQAAGTLRGLTLKMVRRAENHTSPAHGVPEVILGTYTEANLLDIGEPEVKDKDGKVIKVLNDNITAYDYLRIFPQPSAEKLRTLYNIAPPAGSDAANNLHGEQDQWNRNNAPQTGGLPDLDPAQAQNNGLPDLGGSTPPPAQTAATQAPSTGLPALGGGGALPDDVNLGEGGEVLDDEIPF